MSEILATVRVKSDNGYTVINKSDYDKEKHILVDAEEPALTESQEPAKNMTKNQMKAYLDDVGLEYASNASKADLQDLIDENTAE